MNSKGLLLLVCLVTSGALMQMTVLRAAPPHSIENPTLETNRLLRSWYCAGPFETEGISIDAPLVNDEAALSPKTPIQIGERQWQWRKIDGPVLDFQRVFSVWDRKQATDKTAYAWTQFQVNASQSLDLSLGFDDEVAVYLDGKRIFSKGGTSRGCVLDQQRVTVDLEAGSHTLLLRVANGYPPWFSVARFLPRDSTPLPLIKVTNHPWGDLNRLPCVTAELLDSKGTVYQTLRSDMFRAGENFDGVLSLHHKANENEPEHPDAIRLRWNSPHLIDGDQTFDWQTLKQGHAEITFESNRPLEVDVRDQQGAPIVGATMWREKSLIASANESGKIQIERACPLLGQVYLAAPGHEAAKVQLKYPFDKSQAVTMQPGGRTLRGRLISADDGQPIAGAQIVPGLYSGYQPIATSDSDGRFTFHSIPSDKDQLFPVIDAEGYLIKDRFGQPLRPVGEITEVTYELQPGATVVGTVKDTEGRPLAGVTVMVGTDGFSSNHKDTQTKTNAAGDYRLPGVPVGSCLLLAFSDDFAPRVVTAKTQLKQDVIQDFTLDPGKPVEGVITDPAGKPVAGVWVVCDTWENMRVFRRQTHSDDQGRYTLSHMPDTVVLTDFLKRDYVSNRRRPLVGGQQHDVTLNPVMTHRLKIEDASNGKPIADLQIHRGYQWSGRDNIYWQDRGSMREGDYDANSGMFAVRMDEKIDGTSWFRFRAPGYAETQWKFPDAATEPTTETLKLESIQLTRGKVVDAETNQPLPGALVMIGNEESPVQLSHYVEFSNVWRAVDEFTGISAKSDASGQFGITPPSTDDVKKAMLIVLAPDHGMAIMEDAAAVLAGNQPIPVPQFGEVRGVVCEAGEPIAGEGIGIRWLHGSENVYEPRFGFGGTVSTNAMGEFHFEKLPAGRYSLYRVKSFSNSGGDGSMSMYLDSKSIAVRPGQSVVFDIDHPAGSEVAVKVSDANGDVAVNCIATLGDAANHHLKRYDAVRSDDSGWVRFRNVQPGDYSIHVDQYPVGPSAQCGLGNEIASGTTIVKVLPGEPLTTTIDLVAKAAQGQKLTGSLAPELTGTPIGAAEAFSSKSHRGKVIAIDFWATWCGPCIAVMPEMKRLHEMAMADDDLVFVSVSLDSEDAADTLREKIEELGIEFPVLYSGEGWESQLAKKFGVTSIPTSFVIGRDGRFAGEAVHGSKLIAAAEQALAQPYDPAESKTPTESIEIKAYLAGTPGVPGLTLLSQVVDEQGEVIRSETNHYSGMTQRLDYPYCKLEADERLVITASLRGLPEQVFRSPAGSVPESIEFKFEPNAKLVGQLVDDGNPVQQAGIEVRVSSSDGWTTTVPTDGQGRFETSCLAGQYYAVIDSDHWANLPEDLRRSLKVAPSAEPSDVVELEVCQLISISGRIEDLAGNPIGEATVAVSPQQKTQTNAAGEFKLSGVPARGLVSLFANVDKRGGSRVIDTGITASERADRKWTICLAELPENSHQYPQPGTCVTDIGFGKLNGDTFVVDDGRQWLLFADLWRADHAEWVSRFMAEHENVPFHVVATDWTKPTESQIQALSLPRETQVLVAGPGGLDLPKSLASFVSGHAVLVEQGELVTYIKRGITSDGQAQE